MERENSDMWLQGLYYYNALQSALAMAFWNKKGKKPDGYIEYPIPRTPHEKEMEKERRIAATMRFFMDGQKQ